MISFDASRISPSNNNYVGLNTSTNNAHNNTGFDNLVGQLNMAWDVTKKNQKGLDNSKRDIEERSNSKMENKDESISKDF